MTFNAGGNAVDAVEAQTSLESVLKDEIIRMYQEVADSPNAEFHFYHGREFRVLKPGGRIDHRYRQRQAAFTVDRK